MVTSTRFRHPITPIALRAVTALLSMMMKARPPSLAHFTSIAWSNNQTANSLKRIAAMDPQLRSRFNADFTPDKYAALVRCVNETEKWPADFRISETPRSEEHTSELQSLRH